MKRIIPLMLGRCLALFASVLFSNGGFIGAVFAVVVGVVLQPFIQLKTFVDVCSHMLAELLVMMYSAGVSGAIMIGNKLFGSVGLAVVGGGRYRPLRQ